MAFSTDGNRIISPTFWRLGIQKWQMAAMKPEDRKKEAWV